VISTIHALDFTACTESSQFAFFGCCYVTAPNSVDSSASMFMSCRLATILQLTACSNCPCFITSGRLHRKLHLQQLFYCCTFIHYVVLAYLFDYVISCVLCHCLATDGIQCQVMRSLHNIIFYRYPYFEFAIHIFFWELFIVISFNLGCLHPVACMRST
jgi:hypothetical protein